MSFFPASAGTYTLNGSIGSTDTSITLSSFLLPVSGAQITMALLNSTIAYGTIAPKTSNAELISFTGITQNSDGTAILTGVTRGLNKTYPFTTSSTFKLPHSGQSVFILSDAPQVFNNYASTINDQTFAGLNTFTQSPVVPTPSNSTDAASKGYVDGVAIAGAPDSSTTTKGIVKMSVAPASATSPIAVGDNDSRVPTANQTLAAAGNNTDVAVGSGNKFVTQTGLQHAAEQYAIDSSVSANTITVALSPIPTSYTDGMEVKVKVVNATTSAATINVNALGAKTIKKYVAGAIADLVANDIIANQTVTLVYNSGLGFMILQTPTANVPLGKYKTGNTTQDLSSTTTTTIAHGLGAIPKFVRLLANITQASANSALVAAQTLGSFDGTTQNAIYTSIDTNGSLTASGIDTTHAFHLGRTNTGTADFGYLAGTVSVDATNITITWAKTNSPTGTANLIWEAFA